MNEMCYCIKSGDIDTARKCAVEEIEKNPANPEAWLIMGITQANMGDYEWSAQSFEKYLQCMESRNKTN